MLTQKRGHFLAMLSIVFFAFSLHPKWPQVTKLKFSKLVFLESENINVVGMVEEIIVTRIWSTGKKFSFLDTLLIFLQWC
jgi:hypothetical protein